MNAFQGTTGVVLLFSGGVDSTVLAHIALSKNQLSACVFVDYGHPAASEEWKAASRC